MAGHFPVGVGTQSHPDGQGEGSSEGKVAAITVQEGSCSTIQSTLVPWINDEPLAWSFPLSQKGMLVALGVTAISIFCLDPPPQPTSKELITSIENESQFLLWLIVEY